MIKSKLVIVLLLLLPGNALAQVKLGELAHTRTEAHLTLDLPYEVAAPMFGALAEQKWEPDWKPQFLYPNPPADQDGAVFRVDFSPSHSSVWMTTRFDLAGGHIQYVFTIIHAVITRVDITLARNGAGKTDVSVVYERTALDPSVNDDVLSMAKVDARKVAEWKAPIEAYGAR